MHKRRGVDKTPGVVTHGATNEMGKQRFIVVQETHRPGVASPATGQYHHVARQSRHRVAHVKQELVGRSRS
jgi:hypothetical protein